MLPGGLQVQLPLALLGSEGAPPDATQEVKDLYDELNALSKKILKNDFTDSRPEWERSPEPDPVYDQNGVRVNTREIMAKEKATVRSLSTMHP